MKTFFKKQRELIALLAYACLVVAIAYFAIRPILAEINQRRDRIQEEIATQENQKKQVAELPAIKEQYLSVQSKGDAVNVLVRADDAVKLIEQIERLAQSTQNEVKITISQNDPNSREAIIAQKQAASQKQADNKGVSIEDTLPSKKYLEMNITLSGQYNNIVDFIGKIENMRYYGDVLSFQIKRDDSVKSGIASSSGLVANPFSAQDQNAGSQPETPASTDQKLVAILNVVFYLKQ